MHDQTRNNFRDNQCNQVSNCAAPAEQLQNIVQAREFCLHNGLV